MVKVLSFRFKQCVDPFTTLVDEGFCEMGVLGNLANHIFWSL